MSVGCSKRLLVGMLLLVSRGLQAETACSTPMWQDEFDGDTVDNAKWQFVEGDGCDQDLCGWGNDEKQWYLAKNARIEAGALHITGQRERSHSRWYTSAKLTTQGRFAAQYGRFEARMKIPKGDGFWPAFWMMPKSDMRWPLAGEIDILESSGHTPEKVLGAIHFGDLWPNNGTTVNRFWHRCLGLMAFMFMRWSGDLRKSAGLLTIRSTDEPRLRTSPPILGCLMSGLFI